MTRALSPILLAFVMLAVILAPSAARAETRVIESTVENAYPTELIFRLSAEADQEITDVTLRYTFAGRGGSGFSTPETFTPGTSVEVTVELSVNSSNAYIPVGSEFVYHWEITTADGERTSTPEEEFLYLPPDQDWQSVESNIMRVYYHGDRESLALEYLEAGQETYDDIAVSLLQAELPVTPVKVILFADSEDMAPARQGRGGTFDAAVTTCGTKLTSDIVFVIPVSCGTPDVTDTLRHEFGHIINEAAGQGGIGRLPSWIDEGTAVIAQTTPGSNFEGAFEAAVRADRLIPFNQMGTPSNDASQVNLFYGQSWAMVQYLIDRDGTNAFAEYFATMRQGQRFDRAMEEIYGLTLAEFENEFRESFGLEPRSAPDPDPEPPADSGQAEQEQPQDEPTRAPISTTGSSGSGGNLDSTTVLIIGAAVLFALLGVFFYLLSAMNSANRRNAAATADGASADAGDDGWSRRSDDEPPPPPDEYR